MDTLKEFGVTRDSFGYALFFVTAFISTGGGVFPFSPATFQTESVVSMFFLGSLSFTASFFVIALLAYFGRMGARTLMLWASIPYLFGWVLFCALPHLSVDPIPGALVSGILIGWGVGGLFVTWQATFALQGDIYGMKCLIGGTMIAPLLYGALLLLPQSWTNWVIALAYVPVVGAILGSSLWRVDADQAMLADAPPAHPKVYRSALKDYWPSAVCIGSLAFAAGICRCLAINDVSAGVVVNILTMLALGAASLFLLAAWSRASVRLNIVTLFKCVLPAAWALLLVFGLTGPVGSEAIAGALFALLICFVTLAMVQCAQASQSRGVNPLVFYGAFIGVVWLMHDVGFFFFGNLLRQSGLNPDSALLAGALLASVVLGLALFAGVGGFLPVSSPSVKNRIMAENIELISTPSSPATRKRVVGIFEDEEPSLKDQLSKKCAAMAGYCGLTNREAQIMELVARGMTVRAMAEKLVVSENTVRSHMKSIYAKLGIHKKQELIDALDDFSPIQ